MATQDLYEPYRENQCHLLRYDKKYRILHENVKIYGRHKVGFQGKVIEFSNDDFLELIKFKPTISGQNVNEIWLKFDCCHGDAEFFFANFVYVTTSNN